MTCRPTHPGGRQPLRTIFFVIAAVPLVALMIHLAWLLVAAR